MALKAKRVNAPGALSLDDFGVSRAHAATRHAATVAPPPTGAVGGLYADVTGYGLWITELRRSAAPLAGQLRFCEDGGWAKVALGLS